MSSRDAPRIMPFGKYVGTSIEDLPTSYLEWLRKNIDTRIGDWAEEELEERAEDPSHWSRS